MAKFLDLSVNGIALGAVSGGTNTTQALLSTTGSNVLQLSGANTSTLCRLSGVDQPAADTDAANKLYVQSYVLGQIRGLQLKQSVQLASKTPVALVAQGVRASLHWPGPYTNTSGSLDLWGTADNLGRNASAASTYLSTGNMAMSMGFIWSPSVTKGANIGGLGMQWVFNGAGAYGGGDEGGIGMNMGDPNAMIFNSFTNTGGALSDYNPPTSYDDLRLAWSSVAPGTQFCFLWTYQRYTTGANAPGVMSVSWGTLANGVVTPLPDYRSGTTSQSKAQVLPSGFGPSSNPATNNNWNLKALKLNFGSWPNTSSSFFMAPTVLTLQDAFVAAWQPPPPQWTIDGIDGSVPTANSRVLLTGQTNAIENGIWQVNSGLTALVRPLDYPVGGSSAANFVFVDGPGLHNDDQGYLCTSLPGQDVVDTNTTAWMQYTSSGGNVGSLTMGTDSITTASGTLSFVNNNLTTTGAVTSTAHTCGSLSIQAGNIYDASGQINFNTDNLVTTGTVTSGTLLMGAGSITDTTGTISIGCNAVTTGSVTAPHFLTVSDERLKDVTSDLEITPDIYSALRPVCFNWKATGLPDVGLIAQEVQAAAPHAVNKDTNSPEGYMYVDYASLVPYALAIAKGATDRVARLEAKVAAISPMDPQ